MKNNWESTTFNVIELESSALTEIIGGAMSDKSKDIGWIITGLCPILGAAYWLGYYINS